MKVNGIEIKISRKFFGHEGETCYQGTIYENGKKIGTWSNDAWCGPRNVSLDNPRKIGLLNDKIRSFFFEAGLMSAPSDKKAVPFEETELGHGDYLGSLIELSIDEKKGFRVSPTASAKKSSKDGKLGVSLVSVRYDMYRARENRPACFSLSLDNYTATGFHLPVRKTDINDFVRNEFVSARRNGFGMFAIRKNGVAQSGIELCRELEEIAE